MFFPAGGTHTCFGFRLIGSCIHGISFSFPCSLCGRRGSAVAPWEPVDANAPVLPGIYRARCRRCIWVGPKRRFQREALQDGNIHDLTEHPGLPPLPPPTMPSPSGFGA